MTQRMLGKTETDAAQPAWGAAAVATAGDFVVEVDESLSSPEVQLTVDSPRGSITHTFPDADTLVRLLESFQSVALAQAAVPTDFGQVGGATVSLVRDAEGDRFYLCSRINTSNLSLTLTRPDLQALLVALRDVADQLRG